MSKENYNWWTDPKNKETVERISWWNHPENKAIISFPISLMKEDEWWLASCNDETSKLLGDKLWGFSQAKTKEEAINQMFLMIKLHYEYAEECRLSYQRFVPFRKGDWKHTGGRWFTLFGFNFYFRYGKSMKGGWYIPLTKLNIRIHSEWATYKKWKKKKHDGKNNNE